MENDNARGSLNQTVCETPAPPNFLCERYLSPR